MVIDSRTKLNGKREKATKMVETKRIKLHIFLPSGRKVWTAVGSDGDHLLNVSQPYCSCRDFHFRYLTDKDEECYHLLALKMAFRSKKYDTIEFQDEEYVFFIRGLLEEIPHEK
jgi:predicted nucleic acid-binding Zn finger protein